MRERAYVEKVWRAREIRKSAPPETMASWVLSKLPKCLISGHTHADARTNLLNHLCETGPSLK